MSMTIELELIRIMMDALRESTDVYREALKHAPQPVQIAGELLAKRYDSLITVTTNIYEILTEDQAVLEAIDDVRERCRNYRKHSHG